MAINIANSCARSSRNLFDFGFQLVGHLVEGLREQADFVRRGDHQSDAGRPAGKLAGGGGHL
jgi:hypothetical protein